MMWTLTKGQHEILTPKEALLLLKEGNKRFINNLEKHPDLLHQVNQTAREQHPFAVVLSCMDSRTPAELIFDQGLGDIFSIRIAGNVLNDDILASIEFACEVGVKLIAVIGHTRCGAITGACQGTKFGHLTNLLEKIEPLIQKVHLPQCEKIVENPLFLLEVTRLNIKQTMQQIKQQSTMVRTLLEKKKVAMIGGLYCLETGATTFYD